ncbi:MAG: hypothetical protein K0S09_2839 [Sphingobacteriaceae bacterium]|jgi:hypothetical protein|nr:hypothetical protein [Sphingobacteriaceae bacterium]
MFKQFIENFPGSQVYLITSLWLFLVFFIAVGIMLFRMNKEHVDYMSDLPLSEEEEI